MKSESANSLVVVFATMMVFVVFIVLSIAHSNQKKEAASGKHKPHTTISTATINEGHKKNAESNQSVNESRWGAISDWVIVFLTFGLLAVAKAQRDDTNAANTRFEKIESASHETTQKELRAYVSVSAAEDSISLTQRYKGDKHDFSVRIRITNNGNTPAKKVKVYTGAAIRGRDVSLREVVRGDKYPSTIIDISQGGNEDDFISKAFDNEAIERLGILRGSLDLSGRGIHFFGIVRYTDVFGKRWYTQFCYMVVGGYNRSGSGLNFFRIGPFNKAT